MKSSKLKEGTPVVVWRDNGEALLTRTRSEIKTNLVGDPVVFVKGITGTYAMTHVRPVKVDPSVQVAWFTVKSPKTGSVRTIKEVQDRLDKVNRDERLYYEPATVDVNAPLALIQTQLETERRVLRWVLGG